MDAAHQAFDRGDFATARRLARATLASSPDEATRSAAESILKKTSFDPLIAGITVFCLLMFGVIAAFVR
jgi:hypothetical protein